MTLDRLRIAGDKGISRDPIALLRAQGIHAAAISGEADLEFASSDSIPHLALAYVADISEADLRSCVKKCGQLGLPLLALVTEELLAELDVDLGVDDFVVWSSSPAELVTRAKQVIWRRRSAGGAEAIRIGGLAINPTSYEVSVSGKRIDLRFKEYELLRLLASNPGRVYTRESLLSQIWGYDYFGGTRTVDVHIRRLRSKIEDAEQRFIETIWNVGYRFKDLRR